MMNRMNRIPFVVLNRMNEYKCIADENFSVRDLAHAKRTLKNHLHQIVSTIRGEAREHEYAFRTEATWEEVQRCLRTKGREYIKRMVGTLRPLRGEHAYDGQWRNLEAIRIARGEAVEPEPYVAPQPPLNQNGNVDHRHDLRLGQPVQPIAVIQEVLRVPPPQPRQIVERIPSKLPPHIIADYSAMMKELHKEEECPICYDKLNLDDLHITGCGHKFCGPCMTGWLGSLSGQKRCPQCNTKF